MKKNIKLPDYNKIWKHIYGDLQQFGPVHRHAHRIISKILNNLTYDTVLDVGCGPGHNYTFLTAKDPSISYTGIDISSVAIEKAKSLIPGGQFHQLDIEKNFIDHSCGLLFCSLIMEHLPDDMAALANMKKMTQKYLLITTIAGNFDRYKPWENLIGHVRNYKHGELEKKLTMSGFKIKQSIHWGFPFFSPIARTLQNYSTIGSGEYNFITRIVSKLLYWLYYFNCSKKGDLLIILAEKKD